MTVPAYELTAHAAMVMSERGISVAWLERVLAHPERTEADQSDAELHHAIGRIAEYGDRYLRVVYNHRASPLRIVTLFFDRGLRGRE